MYVVFAPVWDAGEAGQKAFARLIELHAGKVVWIFPLNFASCVDQVDEVSVPVPDPAHLERKSNQICYIKKQERWHHAHTFVCICNEKENVWCQKSAPHEKAVQFPLSTDTFWHDIKMPVPAWKSEARGKDFVPQLGRN